MTRNSRNVYGRPSVTSLKQLVAWGDHFKVGHPQLDAQHEAIFNIAMEIAESWPNRGDIERLKGLTEKLNHVLAAHFSYEEQQLAGFGDPGLEAHKAEHKVMLDELQVIRTRLAAMEPGTSSMAPTFMVHNFVLGLTVGHISHSDMAYCAYTRELAKDKANVPAAA